MCSITYGHPRLTSQGHNWNESEQARWSEPGYFNFRDRASGESLSADAAYARFQAEEASVKHLGKRVNNKASELSYLLINVSEMLYAAYARFQGKEAVVKNLSASASTSRPPLPNALLQNCPACILWAVAPLCASSRLGMMAAVNQP